MQTVEADLGGLVQERWASATLLVGEQLNSQLVFWSLGGSGPELVDSAALAADQMNLGNAKSYFRRTGAGGAPEVWEWSDGEAGSTQLVYSPGAGSGVLTVRATATRLWWTVGVSATPQPGFSKIELYTAELPLPALPIAALQPVAELSTSMADSAASSSHYAYHDAASGSESLRVVSVAGNETVVAIPDAAGGVDRVEFFGNDGEVNNSLWFSSGLGMFRLTVPLPP
ncbi:MAG: hypothetical protein AAFN41_12820 [Planctomycetota bacterium]